MIFVNHPYCPPAYGKDLGLAYNEFMSRLRRDDWACFLDHDASFTTRDWYEQLEKAVALKPHAGFFTCKTNRCWCNWQRDPSCPSSDNIVEHREWGRVLGRIETCSIQEIERSKVEETGQWFSGVLILVSRKTWDRVPFRSGLCGVDNQFHWEIYQAGLKVYLLADLYVYHFYRNQEGTKHLEGAHNPPFCKFLGPGTCPVCSNQVQEVPRIS